MGTRAKEKFSERFSGGIRFIYLEKPPSVAEREMQVAGIRRAVTEVLAGVLGREPTEEEILGLNPVQKDEQK